MSLASQGENGQTLPDMSGKVVTVKGPMEPSEVGVTLMHEHMLLDLRKSHPVPPGATASEMAIWEAKVDLSNLKMAMDKMPIQDNYIFSDEGLAIKEVMEFKKRGGKTIADLTSIGLKRDPLAIRRISEATELNIVMGTSWYQKVYHPDDMDRRTVEDLTEEIVRDITIGVGDTGIRSGIIGEVGVNANPLIENEIKVVKASARASVATGAAMTFHGPPREDRHRILDMLEEEGVDLTRVVLGHCDGLAGDLPFMLELLERGPYIEFDTLGRVHPATVVPGNTMLPAAAVPKLIDSGYGDRVLLSQDVCWKVHYQSYGGTGYSYVQEAFLPHLRSVGVTEDQLNQIMVESPKRLLTFVAPR